MEHADFSFAQAFDADLRASNIEQSRVCELLSVEDEVPISTAAISNWKRRDRLPYRRLQKLVEIFGPQSECAKYMEWVDTQQPSGLTPRRAPFYNLMEDVKEPDPERGNLAKSTAGDSLKRLVNQFTALLAVIPPNRRDQAVGAAIQALLDYLPHPPSDGPTVRTP